MGCEKLTPYFAQAEISLEEFLTISNKRMEEIGIEMLYQRASIHYGLFKFFNAKWTKNSLFVPSNLRSHVSSIDLINVLNNILRHIIVMKCQLLYYQQFKFTVSSDNMERFLNLDFLIKFQNNLEDLERKVKKLKSAERPLMIQKKKATISKKAVIIGVSSGFLSIFALKFFLFKN